MDLTGPQLSRRTFTRSAVVLGAAGALAGLGALGTARAASSPGGADWLAALPDSAPLARLTIPGTHDTCALYDGPLVQCQTLSVPDQLTAGIRFLDMRCRAINGVFAIHHSQFFQNIFFGDVLNDCQAFLAQHPGETVLMRVKQEYSTISDADFAAIFNTYLSRWTGLFWMENRIPTLGEVRGRVVLLADNGGLPGIGWNGPLVDLEDDYDIGTIFDFNGRKWPEVSAHLSAAEAATDPQRLFITFTSSSGWGLWPRQAADAMNSELSGYLTGLDHASCPALGVVPMDFVTTTSPAAWYGLNFGA